MAGDKHFHSKRDKWGRETSETKANQNPVGQTLNPVAPCPAPRARCEIQLWRAWVALCWWLYFSWLLFALSLLIPFGFLQIFYIPGFFNFLGSQIDFQLLFHGFMHSPVGDTLPGLLGLSWNLGGSFPDPVTVAFCMPVKPAPHRWPQGLLPAQAVALWN